MRNQFEKLVVFEIGWFPLKIKLDQKKIYYYTYVNKTK